MSFEEFNKTIKAALYKRLGSPFTSTFIISWLVYNWVFWSTLLLNSAGVENKVEYLSKIYGTDWYIYGTKCYIGDIWLWKGLILPIISAIILIEVVPKYTLRFYESHLDNLVKRRALKLKKDAVTPLTQEESDVIREELTKLESLRLEDQKRHEAILRNRDREIKQLKEDLSNFSSPKEITSEGAVEEADTENILEKIKDFFSSEVNRRIFLAIVPHTETNTNWVRPPEITEKILTSLVKNGILRNVTENVSFTEKGEKYYSFWIENYNELTPITLQAEISELSQGAFKFIIKDQQNRMILFGKDYTSFPVCKDALTLLIDYISRGLGIKYYEHKNNLHFSVQTEQEEVLATSKHLVSSEERTRTIEFLRTSIKKMPIQYPKGHKMESNSKPSSAPQFLVYKDDRQRFYFTLTSDTGKIILNGVKYKTKEDVMSTIIEAKNWKIEKSTFEPVKTSEKLHGFNLRNPNGNLIGRSELYSTTSARDVAIEKVQEIMPNANVIDHTKEIQESNISHPKTEDLQPYTDLLMDSLNYLEGVEGTSTRAEILASTYSELIRNEIKEPDLAKKIQEVETHLSNFFVKDADFSIPHHAFLHQKLLELSLKFRRLTTYEDDYRFEVIIKSYRSALKKVNSDLGGYLETQIMVGNYEESGKFDSPKAKQLAESLETMIDNNKEQVLHLNTLLVALQQIHDAETDDEKLLNQRQNQVKTICSEVLGKIKNNDTERTITPDDFYTKILLNRTPRL